VYAAGSHCLIERGPQCYFTAVLYADIGSWADRQAPDGADQPCEVSLNAYYLGESKGALLKSKRFSVAQRPFLSASRHRRLTLGPADELPDGTPPLVADWRRVTLTVDHRGVAAGWEDQRFGVVTPAQLEAYRDKVAEEYPDITAENLPVSLDGSIGVFLYEGAATVRRLSVRAVPEE
jgi:hypothetical protein